MKFKTGISVIKDNKERLQGYSLSELARAKSFGEVIFLTLRGQLPTANELTIFNALLVMAIDHGPGTVSAQNARVAASAKVSTQAALAAGILAMGDRHGGAVGNAAQFFTENKNSDDVKGLITSLREQRIRIPGYGHATLTKDQRSEVLFEIARSTQTFGEHSQFALATEEALNAVSSKPLPLNVDGAMAAILLDLGFLPEMTTGVFIIARLPGLLAHIIEETTNDEGIRRVQSDEIEYTGPSERELV